MERYDTYKDSGIEWIGDVPEHWELKRIKHFCYVKGRVGWKGLKSSDFLRKGYSYLVTGSDFKTNRINWKKCYQIDQKRYEEDPYIQLKKDDLLITKDGTIGKLAIVDNLDKPACLNSGIFVVRSLNNKLNTQYLYWILYSDVFKNFNDYTTYGSTIQHLYQNVFVDFAYNLPNKQEQTKIANYLDQKTTEINQLITQKETLLKHYAEEKTAIINQAVTKGINPKVKLRDSGIDWLGEIPVHWEVKKLSYCFNNIGSGTTPKSGNQDYYFNGEFNWLQTGDLNNREINRTSKKITQKALDKHSTLRFYPSGSIVIAMYGATIGKMGLLNIKTTTNQACCVLAEPNGVLAKFVFYWFLSMNKHIISMGYGGGQPNINQEQVRTLKIQLPKPEEQTQIVNHIETETKKINTKVEKTKKLIELLKEYKTALISEVVTGKIKVN